MKKNSVVVKLRKVKGEKGYDYWGNLTSKTNKRIEDIDSKNPRDGILEMMKEMYDDGDEKTRRMIGEAMSKEGPSTKSFLKDDY